MEEKKNLTKGKQIFLGVIIGILIYGLYFLAFSFIEKIIGIIFMLILPIVIIFVTVKLIRGETYKTLGVTIISFVSPILIFALVAGSCLSMYLYN